MWTRSGLIVVGVLLLAVNAQAEDWQELTSSVGTRMLYDADSARYDAQNDTVKVRARVPGMRPRWDAYSCSRYVSWLWNPIDQRWVSETILDPSRPDNIVKLREMLCGKKRSLPAW